MTGFNLSLEILEIHWDDNKIKETNTYKCLRHCELPASTCQLQALPSCALSWKPNCWILLSTCLGDVEPAGSTSYLGERSGTLRLRRALKPTTSRRLVHARDTRRDVRVRADSRHFPAPLRRFRWLVSPLKGNMLINFNSIWIHLNKFKSKIGINL